MRTLNFPRDEWNGRARKMIVEFREASGNVYMKLPLRQRRVGVALWEQPHYPENADIP